MKHHSSVFSPKRKVVRRKKDEGKTISRIHQSDSWPSFVFPSSFSIPRFRWVLDLLVQVLSQCVLTDSVFTLPPDYRWFSIRVFFKVFSDLTLRSIMCDPEVLTKCAVFVCESSSIFWCRIPFSRLSRFSTFYFCCLLTLSSPATTSWSILDPLSASLVPEWFYVIPCDFSPYPLLLRSFVTHSLPQLMVPTPAAIPSRLQMEPLKDAPTQGFTPTSVAIRVI